MIRYCDWTRTQWAVRHRAHAKSLAAVLTAAVLLQPSLARAATIDWNVSPGPADYDSALDPDAGATPNWIDTTQAVPVAPPAVPPSNAPVGIPAATDDAFVRNGGLAEITSAITNNSFWVGSARTLYTDDGINVIQNEVGGNGTVNMTGGSLTGSGPNGLTLRLGGVGLAAAGSPVFTGIFIQSGGTVTMGVGGNPGSIINIGSQGAANPPTSTYYLSGTGQIKMKYDAGNHLGINVRNGIFDMSGGSISDIDADGVGLYDQRFLTVSTTSGPSNAQHNTAYAYFSGNAVVNVHHGIRVAPNNRADGYVEISGNANIKLGNDLQLAANAGTAGSVDAAYGQLDMSGGYLQVGQYTTTDSHFDKRFIIGDNGRGVFTQTGGNVLVGNELRMSNNAVSSALMTMKDPAGGPTGVPFTFTTKGIETRQVGTTDTSLNSDILINSPDATFIQTNMVHPVSGTVLAGLTRIGGSGKSTFEIQQGNVLLGQATGVSPNLGGNIELSRTAAARATLKLLGGKLTLGGNVTRTDTSAATKPVITLTGGQLILNPLTSTPTTHAWQTDMTIAGTQLTTKANALLTVNVGVGTTLPGNFVMSSGSWDLDIGPGAGALDNASDRILMLYTTTPATGSLLGGTLNLNYLSGYVPAVGDSRLIVRSATGGTSTLGAITINAPGGDPNWIAVLANTNNRDIRLQYIPEPASCALVVVGFVGMIGLRRRSRKCVC